MAIIFIVFSIAFALPNYAQYQFSPLGPQIIERFGLTAMQFNSIFTSPMLPAIFTSIISGMLVDRYGYKPVMGAALFLTAVGAWLRVFAEGYGVMYVGMVLIGFSAGFLSSNASKILSQLFGAEKVGVMMGMALTLSTCTLILAMSTTTMLGPMGNAFMLGAVVATIILVLWFVVMPGIKPGIMVQSAADSTDEAPGLIESLRVAIKNRHVWFAGLALFCVGGAMTGMGSMVPTALMESRGISEAAAGVVGAFLMVGNLLGSLITPTLSLKLGKFRAVLMVCGVMSLLGCAFAWRVALSTPFSFWFISTFPMTVFQGNSAYFWNTIPRSPIFGRPSAKMISPEVAFSRSAIILSRTVFPHCPGPSRTRNSFSFTSSVISFNTSTVRSFR